MRVEERSVGVGRGLGGGGSVEDFSTKTRSEQQSLEARGGKISVYLG